MDTDSDQPPQNESPDASSDESPDTSPASIEPPADDSPVAIPGWRALAWNDLKRIAAVTLFGALAVAVFELVATLVATPVPDVRIVTILRLVFIDVTLTAIAWIPVAGFLVLACVTARATLAARSRDRAASWPGLLAVAHGDSNPAGQEHGSRPLAAWLWSGALVVALYLTASSILTFRAMTFFKNQALAALLLAVVQLVLIAGLAFLGYVLAALLYRAGQRLHRLLGPFNPFGQTIPALVLIAALCALALRLVLLRLPEMAPLIPWRFLLVAAVFVIGCQIGQAILSRRGRLFPAPGRARTRAIAATALGALILMPLTLLVIGADHEAKSVAQSGSPFFTRTMDGVRVASDFDRDSYGFLLGENDCAPFNARIHPLAREIPDNDIDEDCNGRDFSIRTPPSYKQGERLPVPPDYARDWNILLLTIDTVRYDHTGFGGYLEKSGRETTPNLDKLVERSVSFTYANAPSPGTMASIPAILTSRFFHSGVAMDVTNIKPRMPPRLKPQNTLISEVVKTQGYTTGAILTHQYFNDWGMEQGFDTYDNSLGAKYDPYIIAADKVTDKIKAWVARHGERKWFLWAHYIDPHGRYVAHPGERSFGTEEKDLYDGELYFTDKHIGRLLRDLSMMPGADRTIIIITSDHGDGFNEHGFINHAVALYRELLHVPLIIYVPELPPRLVDGAVSGMDIFPTIAELAGADIRGMDLEGESLIPQLFYGKDAHHRVVFAETDYPRPLRGAMTSKYKLIYKLKSNLYEFYDLTADPWEKRNLYKKNQGKEFGEMKGYLEDWLERVYYSRDTTTNQAGTLLDDFLLDEVPAGITPVTGVSFDEGRIELIGYETAKKAYTTDEVLEVAVYFRVTERPGAAYRLQLESWPVVKTPGGDEVRDGAGNPPGANPGASPGPVPPGRLTARGPSSPRYTAGGLFPTTRWRKGEIIRDRFKVRIPPRWQTGDAIEFGVLMASHDLRKRLPVSGPSRPGAPHVAVVGQVAYEPKPVPAKDSK